MTKISSSKNDKDPLIEMLHLVLDEAAIFIIGNFPYFKKATINALETIFATKTLARQLALVSMSSLDSRSCISVIRLETSFDE
mmetsp:Transcript_20205/g.23126  ORF Transcript_20205/g.23126 Transcript_20205/m.23126 type:complete len:83 (-) Transcript_20205:4335-4583(-)